MFGSCAMGYRGYSKRPALRRLCLSCIAVLLSRTALGQTCNDNMPASRPTSQFAVDGGEVHDKETGLIWQLCSLGQSGADCSVGAAATYTWQGALHAAEAERAASGKAWRLPNVKELRFLVEEKCFDPAIDRSVFPNTLSGAYWTGSPAPASGYQDAWAVFFDTGYSSYTVLGAGNPYVRLVRDGF